MERCSENKMFLIIVGKNLCFSHLDSDDDRIHPVLLLLFTCPCLH